MHYNTDIMSPGHFETIQGGLKIIKSQGIQIINSFDILTKRIGSHK